eukprot:gene8011-8871_t
MANNSESLKLKRQAVLGIDVLGKEDFGNETINQTIKELQDLLRQKLKVRKDRELIYKAYIDLGAAYYRLFKFDKAEACHWKHLNMAKEKKFLNEEQVKTALTNLGCVFRQRMQFEEALMLYKEALEIAERIEDLRGYARLLNNMANIYENTFDLESAIECHMKRAEIAIDLKDTDGQIKAYACLGGIFHLQGELRKSILYYQKVIINIRMKLVKQQAKVLKEKEAEAQRLKDEAGEIIDDPNYYDKNINK